MVAVELVAVDSKDRREMVVWLGCVHYDGVRRVWETRSSQTVSQRLSQTNLLSMFGQTKVMGSESLEILVQLIGRFFTDDRDRERNFYPQSLSRTRKVWSF